MKMQPKNYVCMDCGRHFDYPVEEHEYRDYGMGYTETIYYCPCCGDATYMEKANKVNSICFDCKYYMTCGETNRTQPCKGREEYETWQ